MRATGSCRRPAWVSARRRESSTRARARSCLKPTPEHVEPLAVMGVLPWAPLRGGQLTGKYVRDAAPADSLRAGLRDGPTEREWVVIDAVAWVAAEIGVGSAAVALAWVRS